jgi:uncharacterized membrane protein YqiK
VVESVDGDPIQTGRLLADEVECASYQDAKKFLNGGGKKGPQVAILRPGTYRINTNVFTVTALPITRVPKEKVGVVVAQDGTPLPPGFIIAPKPKESGGEKTRPHKFFQDGQAFLESGGYRGPQLDTLQPGEYYINPQLFRVELYDVAEVPTGYVAVLRSNVGQELETDPTTPSSISAVTDFKQPVHESVERLLIMDRDRRGILRDPVAPGKYNLNPIAYTPYLVPTSAVTIDWAAGSQIRTEMAQAPSQTKQQKDAHKEVVTGEKATEFFKFAHLRVTSRDGFQLDVDVRMIIRIRPEHAPFIIARFGSVSNLIEQIVHPLIDSSFRNKAGEEKAIGFIQGRSDLQMQALNRAREQFQQYFVEAQNLLIAYIAVDKSLLETQTKKEIAIQQQEQYQQEARAELERIAVQEQKARADKQAEVIAAKLSIDISAAQAEAARRQAEGARDSTRIKAEGDSEALKRISEGEGYALRVKAEGEGQAFKLRADGEAEAVRKVGEATADAYKAQSEVVGPERLAVLKVLEQVASGEIKITPDVMVSGGGDGVDGGLFSAWMASMLAPNGNGQTDDGKKKK